MPQLNSTQLNSTQLNSTQLIKITYLIIFVNNFIQKSRYYFKRDFLLFNTVILNSRSYLCQD